ncbi:hypothetical protein AG1IA_06511 [Rhizoctonia solani AG-1 IA]|uniref:Uncharacterized protein n=1 Tax=Thanatephorus cucumeris (strain AG1-IA) TaxID=983506 RepID=L8WRN5_THACA|nr:hypothetical protein AG1IA_06511 [Rhizoctonia solani AG-1 IA]
MNHTNKRVYACTPPIRALIPASDERCLENSARVSYACLYPLIYKFDPGVKFTLLTLVYHPSSCASCQFCHARLVTNQWLTIGRPCRH